MKQALFVLAVLLASATSLIAEETPVKVESGFLWYGDRLQTQIGKDAWEIILKKENSGSIHDQWVEKARQVLDSTLSHARDTVKDEKELEAVTLAIEYWAIFWADKIQNPSTVALYFNEQIDKNDGRADRFERMSLWLMNSERNSPKSRIQNFCGTPETEVVITDDRRTFYDIKSEDLAKNPALLIAAHRVRALPGDDSADRLRLVEAHWNEFKEKLQKLPVEEKAARESVIGKFLAKSYGPMKDSRAIFKFSYWPELKIRTVELWAIQFGISATLEDLTRQQAAIDRMAFASTDNMVNFSNALYYLTRIDSRLSDAEVKNLQEAVKDFFESGKFEGNSFNVLRR
jgi:hypothetical protein